MRIERQYLLRFTLKSGRQIDEWTSKYTVRSDQTGLIGLSFNSASSASEVLGFRVSEFALVQLVGRRWRLRWGRAA